MTAQVPQPVTRRGAVAPAAGRLVLYAVVLAVMAVAAYLVGVAENPCTVDGDSCDDDFFRGVVVAFWTLVVGVAVCVALEVVRFVRLRSR